MIISIENNKYTLFAVPDEKTPVVLTTAYCFYS